MQHQAETSTHIAAGGGILLSIVGNLTGEDITRTVLLGTLGTVVSYVVSGVLKKLSARIKKR